MDTFLHFINFLARIPVWIPVFIVPAAGIAFAILSALAGLRRLYLPAAVGLVGCGFALLAARGDLAAALVYLGAAVALFSMFSLFLLLPHVRRKQKGSREEQIYRKFREDLEPPQPDALPPKVCCFAEPATAEESGMRLAYVDSLIKKLKNCKLTPADRLELEALGRSVDSCRGRPLSGEELGALNDCLAAVLKLTAKYKL